ncbi:hypothetical protein CCR94_08090 [Rhodoblastus sphagnicola]|uniref:Secretin/TonB short N-terminal domain-containing protein n=2 Tax=Rhodoblastus sphagnicola TaxID=333368 RepID=A0A2S6NAW0_9HYPH|nr:hypothetical protein CCR94_08090 [Rhodoblastus sphagnicola]
MTVVQLAVARAQAKEAVASFELDIPAQPLADALVSYGASTGLQVFYDGALAIGRRSMAVKGAYQPMPGLRALLRGTGYLPVATANSDTITILRAPPAAEAHAHLRNFDRYFALLQSRLSEALCDADLATPQRDQAIVSLWLDRLGAVARVQLVNAAGDEHLATAIQGLQIGAPPADLPQPVTMVIFAPSPGEPAGCSAPDRRRASSSK